MSTVTTVTSILKTLDSGDSDGGRIGRFWWCGWRGIVLFQPVTALKGQCGHFFAPSCLKCPEGGEVPSLSPLSLACVCKMFSLSLSLSFE